MNSKCRCSNCHKTFNSAIAFEAHECVTRLEELTLEQLMETYRQTRGPGSK